jgi:malate permease and related proteins
VTNIVLLFICVIVGILFRLSHRLPDNAHVVLNAFIIHVSLPALIIYQIHRVILRPELIFSALMPWLLFIIGAAFFFILSHALHFSRGTTGALMLTGGLANTSFVGLPMIEAFFGAPDMATGIVIDQLGTYLVLSTLGIMVAAFYSAGPGSTGAVLKRIMLFPPLIALVVALLLMPLEFPPWASDALKRLGDTLAPLALVSVGLQLRLDQTDGNKVPLLVGLGFKLLIVPAVIAFVYFGMFHDSDETSRVTIFESAMGPQIGGAIVAAQHGLNPPLVSLMVGVGIVLSFLTLPLWSYFLHQW